MLEITNSLFFKIIGGFYEITVTAYIDHGGDDCGGCGRGVNRFAYARTGYADEGGFRQFGKHYRQILHDNAEPL
jgi:hypothetical protein